MGKNQGPNPVGEVLAGFVTTPEAEEMRENLDWIYQAAARVAAAREEVETADRSAESAKARLKEAKGDWEEAVAEQQKLIADLRSGKGPGPLFDAARKAAEEQPAGAAAPADDWRSVKLSAFLPEKLAGVLGASFLETVGDLHEAYARGMTLEELGDSAGLTDDELEQLRAGLVRFRQERGGEVVAAFPDEWLAPPGSAPEPEAKPKRKGKPKALPAPQSNA